MVNNYHSYHPIIHYWRIEIISTLENDTAHFVFKGKTLDGALKSAQKYCDNSNSKIKYKTLSVGKVLYECDFYGRKEV